MEPRPSGWSKKALIWWVGGALVVLAGAVGLAWGLSSNGGDAATTLPFQADAATLRQAVDGLASPDPAAAAATVEAYSTDAAVAAYQALTDPIVTADATFDAVAPECADLQAQLASGVSEQAFLSYVALPDEETASLLLEAHAARDRAVRYCASGDREGYDTEAARARLIEQMVRLRLEDLEGLAP